MDNDDLLHLNDICEKYFGVKPAVARRRAALGTLPVSAFRLADSRKGPLFVRKSDLENLIDDRCKKADELRSQMAAV